MNIVSLSPVWGWLRGRGEVVHCVVARRRYRPGGSAGTRKVNPGRVTIRSSSAGRGAAPPPVSASTK